MTVSTFESDTQTASIGTEHFISNPNQAGVFELHIDLVNMAAGDLLEVRIYKMVESGGTARVVYLETFQGAQPADGVVFISVPISNSYTDSNSVRFSIKQTTGTGRSYVWAVLKHA